MGLCERGFRLEVVMQANLSNIKWKWVFLGVVIAFAVAYGSSICVVTGYSTYLAFQAMGAPDQIMINTFAENTAEGVVAIIMGVGTLVGGLLAGRKAPEAAGQNGLAVGITTALIGVIIGFTSGFNLWTIVSIILSIVGGWIGGQLANKRSEGTVDI